jgi:phospholipase A1/A2
MSFLAALTRRAPRVRSLAWWLVLAAGAALAQEEPGAPLARCARIAAAPERLACYDALAGRGVEPDAPPSTSTLKATDTPSQLARPPAGTGSLLSKYWELEPEDKRGVFNAVGYRANYFLPIHATTRINRAPQSPTQAAVLTPDYRHVESKIQLSLRTKVLQGLLVPEADVWVGYTQSSLWQIYNSPGSKPFRNTDYETEAMLILRTPQPLRRLPFGWQWRYSLAGLAHQSNGQADPLSRSWNRVYLGAGVERGDVSLTVRVLRRLREDLEDDNNPDLTDYRGRGELQLTWTPGAATASLLYRSTFKSFKRGALQFEWTRPVYDDQPNGLRWYVQVFSGYAETLTDYNFHQTSFGAGLSFLAF